ncbi:MAG: DedA family protein [Lentisphaerae bacterium]|nr:MAG: DedA family protein [Lentisphaerota bacterium]
MRRLLIVFFGFFGVFVLIFALAVWTGIAEETIWLDWLQGLKSRSAVWWGTILLLGLDLIFPVPSSLVMTYAGKELGLVEGTLAGFCGSMACSIVGYSLCRWGGRKWFARFVGDADEEQRVREWLMRYGGWMLLLSRPIPMFTEMTACLAGLTGFKMGRFLFFVTLGTLPMALIYAWYGQKGIRGNLHL